MIINLKKRVLNTKLEKIFKKITLLYLMLQIKILADSDKEKWWNGVIYILIYMRCWNKLLRIVDKRASSEKEK